MNGSDLICGASAFLTTLGVTNAVSMDNPWMNLLVAVLSAIIFGVINIGGKILTGWLVKKGIISKEDKKDIDKKVDDLTDDGKINGSNDIDNLDKK